MGKRATKMLQIGVHRNASGAVLETRLVAGASPIPNNNSVCVCVCVCLLEGCLASLGRSAGRYAVTEPRASTTGLYLEVVHCVGRK